MNEQSGVLPAAVAAFLEGRESQEQLGLVVASCAYWVGAPCWAHGEDLDKVRKGVTRIRTRDALIEWLHEAVALGIDPL